MFLFISPPNFKKKAVVGGTRYLESNVAVVKKENKAYETCVSIKSEFCAKQRKQRL